jgi:hypothetical protein
LVPFGLIFNDKLSSRLQSQEDFYSELFFLCRATDGRELLTLSPARGISNNLTRVLKNDLISSHLLANDVAKTLHTIAKAQGKVEDLAIRCAGYPNNASQWVGRNA